MAKIAKRTGNLDVFIRNLRIDAFRNHGAMELDFSPNINCFHGVNGAGKTNILDAIYFLGNGRSYFTRSDQNNIPFNLDDARWELDYEQGDTQHCHQAQLHREGGKSIWRNGALIKRLSDFIHHLPMVMITPSDIGLITGSSEERRRLMDRCISLLDPVYLRSIQDYNKALLRRNEQLKQFAERRYVDDVLLDTLDQQLAQSVSIISAGRSQFMVDFGADVRNIYSELSNDAEEVEVGYDTEVDPDRFVEQLKNQRQADLRAQRTTQGLHRDDLSLELDGMDARKFASQGQVKSLTIAMNLAIYRMLNRELQRAPILLLDDVFEKIDDHRSSKLMELIAGSGYGQIFITDTSLERMTDRLQHVKTDKKFFNIERRKPVSQEAIGN